jgi:hypothetical protein
MREEEMDEKELEAVILREAASNAIFDLKRIAAIDKDLRGGYSLVEDDLGYVFGLLEKERKAKFYLFVNVFTIVAFL